MSGRLREISLSGFRTIANLDRFEPGSLNVLIGANAAGKSNFIRFFHFLHWLLTPPGQLQLYVGENGGASSFLHYGVERTKQIDAHLKIETDAGINEYRFRLTHGAGDKFIFADERYRFSRTDLPTTAQWTVLPPGGFEAELNSRASSGDRTAKTIHALIRTCVVHQFHNTSHTSRIKMKQRASDNRYLKEDAANLGPFLLKLREHEPTAYQRITETIRLVFPLFADFELDVVGEKVLLQWTEQGSDMVFDASQGSDGLLRFFAMAVFLLQPADTMPDVLLIDEPELGLHPHALEVLAGLLQKASSEVQVIVSTQSASLVNQFRPEDIVVVNRDDEGVSHFRRLGADELSAWLDDYTLGELWQKNYIEGASNG